MQDAKKEEHFKQKEDKDKNGSQRAAKQSYEFKRVKKGQVELQSFSRSSFFRRLSTALRYSVGGDVVLASRLAAREGEGPWS